ncbi:MAG: GNVR domain-containing protein [Bacillota bacterium]|nr:GNVR domain-containing protein [Bacillota bacterium]
MDEEISLREMVEALWRRRVIVAGVTGVAVLAAAILSFWVLAPVFEARVVLAVTPPREPAARAGTEAEGLLDSVGVSLPSGLEAYRIQITHPEVLQKAIARAHLDLSAEQLASSVEARVLKDTNLIEVKVRRGSAQEAAMLANALVQEYVAHMGAFGAERSDTAVAYLKDRMAEAESALADAMQDWKEFLGAPRGTEELQAEIRARLESLTGMKREAESLAVEAEALSAALAEAKSVADEQPALLKARRSLVEDDALREFLAALPGGDRSVLSAVGVVDEEVNPAHVEALNRVNELRVRLAECVRRRDALTRVAASAQRELEALRLELAEKELEEERLQTRLQTLKDAYLGLSKRYEEVRMAEPTWLARASIQVVAPAAVPPTPVRPRKALNISVAGVLGLMVGVFLAFFLDYWERSAPTHAAPA